MTSLVDRRAKTASRARVPSPELRMGGKVDAAQGHRVWRADDPLHRAAVDEAAEVARRDSWSQRPVAQGPTGTELDLARIWSHLIGSRLTMIATFYTECRCHIVLASSKPGDLRPLPPSCELVLEQLLLGESRKVIALERHCTERSVYSAAARALRQLGCRDSISCIAMPLFTLVHAACGLTDITTGHWGTLGFEDTQYRLLSLTRVDCCLDEFVSPAEAAVARLLVEGYSHQQICALRRTARGTVANQLGSAFKKLGVSGRSELICVLHRDRLMWRARAAQQRPAVVLNGSLLLDSQRAIERNARRRGSA